MTYPFRLRRAAPTDKAAVIDIAKAIDPYDYIPDEYDHMMTVNPPEGLYVAEQDGTVIACHYVQFPGPGDAYLMAMRLSPACQGKGLGTLLCRAQIDQARSLGGENIYLLSKAENIPAHRTVAKNGFENLGEWVVYDGINPVELPAPVKARAGRPQDMLRVMRFRQEHEGGALSGVIAARHEPYAVKTLRDSDWEPARMAVCETSSALQGLMLYHVADDRLLVRRLEGTPEAAADLLAYAAAESRKAGCTEWCFSLPKASAPLLAPLKLDALTAFKAYVFCLPAGKELT